MKQDKLKAILENVRKDIESYGWQALAVAGDDPPDFAYTIGLTETFNHPEIIISGLNPQLMQDLLNDMGELIKEGRTFEDGQTVPEIIKGYPVRFVSLSAEQVGEFLRIACIYYGRNVAALQCQWPDKDGLFPSDTGCSTETVQYQALVS